jgi:hypothetical protein
VLIEEQELHYSPEQPLRAWRLFRVRAKGDGLVLSSPMYHDDSSGLTPLWPARRSVAVCYEDHEAPAAGCRCGIYGAVEGTLDSLPGYLHDTAYETDPWAYAEIACHGRVFVDMRGVRAQHASLRRVALPDTCYVEKAAREVARRGLGERYGVCVTAMEAVPEWLTAGSRDTGAPADEVQLDLDLERLDLRT